MSEQTKKPSIEGKRLTLEARVTAIESTLERRTRQTDQSEAIYPEATENENKWPQNKDTSLSILINQIESYGGDLWEVRWQDKAKMNTMRDSLNGARASSHVKHLLENSELNGLHLLLCRGEPTSILAHESELPFIAATYKEAHQILRDWPVQVELAKDLWKPEKSKKWFQEIEDHPMDEEAYAELQRKGAERREEERKRILETAKKASEAFQSKAKK